jgi:hypothetical protein
VQNWCVNAPPIDIIHDLISVGTVPELDILLNPANEVILESALDELMQNIRSDELMDIGTREVCSKRLNN